MGYQNRELERKFIIKNNLTLNQCFHKLNQIYGAFCPNVYDISKDTYYKNTSKVDIIRLRESEKGTEFTVKKSLSGDNTNRIEIDSFCDKNIYNILKLLHGKPLGIVTKKYLVFFLDDKDTSVSIYQIKGCSKIYLEIEARRMNKVDKICKKLAKEFKLQQEFRSIYQIYIKNKINLK